MGRIGWYEASVPGYGGGWVAAGLSGGVEVGGLNPSLLSTPVSPLHLSPSSPALRPLIEKVGLPMFSPYSQAQRQSDYFSPAFITPPTKGGTIALGGNSDKNKKIQRGRSRSDIKASHILWEWRS
jgi:hypothetical protein